MQRRIEVVAALDAALQRRPQEQPAAVNTARRLALFGRNYDERAL